MVDHWTDFWIRETGTGQQAAQLREIYDDEVNERNTHFINWYFNFWRLLLVSKQRFLLQEYDFMYRHAIAYFTYVSFSGLVRRSIWVVSWHFDRFFGIVNSFYVSRLYMNTLIKTHCSYWTRSLCSDGIARNSMILPFFQMLKVSQTLDTLILQSS